MLAAAVAVSLVVPAEFSLALSGTQLEVHPELSPVPQTADDALSCSFWVVCPIEFFWKT